MSKLEPVWEALFKVMVTRNRWALRDRQRASSVSSEPPEQNDDAVDPVVSALRNVFAARGDTRWGGRQHGEHLSPKMLVDFVEKLGQRTKPASILDPVCGYGMLLAGGAEAAESETVHGVELNEQATEVASVILGDRAGLVNGDAFAPFDGMLDSYDMIVADPPLGMRLNDGQISAISLTSRSVGFDGGLLVWAASRITERGMALVVVAPSFFFSKTIKKKAYEAIHDAECRIAAAIHIPEGSRFNTKVGSYLVLLEPGEQEDIFIGQLSPDAGHQDQLLANLLRRKPKGGPSLGRLCSRSDFIGYESFVAKENLSRLARERGWADYAAEMVFPQQERLSEQRKERELIEGPDSLYLELVGRCRATTQLDELRTGDSQKLRGVLHLKVDPKIADPSFLAHYFNESRVGRLALSALRIGTSRQLIAHRDFRRSIIHLPAMNEQRLFIEGAAYLGKVRAETEELASALWSVAEPIEDLVGQIQSINQDDRYQDWLETLPFPLASILWRHHASSSDSYQHRYGVLLHFFEATAAFLATLHLSAMMKDDEVWEEHGDRLNEKLSKNKLSLDHATFGTWKLVAELLGGVCRSKINDEEETSRWQGMYDTTDLKVLEMISDSELLGVLQQANKVRNDYQGHGGAISEDDAKLIHDQLESLVDRLRGLFGRNWQRYELIQPDVSRFQRGMHNVTCKRLMGTRSAPFEERVYESRDPLEAGGLYLFDSVRQSGLKLRPFIKVMPSPEKKAVACFIFNRIDKGDTRWVSYHLEQESDISYVSEGLVDSLAMLNQFKGVDHDN